MKITLKPVRQQVMVITGASSGIGLATAEEAASRGARVVLAARSIQTLNDIVERIEKLGGEALAVECDVSERAQVERVADRTIEEFGRIDTWINNAGVSIYGKLDEVSEEDCRRLFDTNFWGVFNGSLTALPHLRKEGGALINLGSEVSEAVLPIQGIYSASKHAVKGFTDALRVEVQEVDESPVAITLIQPTAVNTPYALHAKNYLSKESTLPTPQLEPETVAEAILEAAEKPVRDKRVGAVSKIDTAISKLVPSLGDKLSAMQADRQHRDHEPIRPDGALYEASNGGYIHGDDERRALQ